MVLTAKANVNVLRENIVTQALVVVLVFLVTMAMTARHHVLTTHMDKVASKHVHVKNSCFVIM